MWLFTRYGMFSVVSKGGGMQVRSRSKAHLRALIRRLSTLESRRKWKIIETPDNDYGWRIVLTRTEWCAVAYSLAEEVTWDNFKAEAERAGTDSQYIAALHGVWRTMFQYQTRTAREVKRPTRLSWEAE